MGKAVCFVVAAAGLAACCVGGVAVEVLAGGCAVTGCDGVGLAAGGVAGALAAAANLLFTLSVRLSPESSAVMTSNQSEGADIPSFREL